MKTLLSPRRLKLLLPGCGILGLLLRLLLAATGTDDKGLILSFHPAWIALLALSAAVLAALLLSTGAIQGPAGYRNSFPFSIPAAVGCTLAAITAARAVIAHFEAGPIYSGPPTLLANILIIGAYYLTGVLLALASAAFILAALGHLNEWQPNFLIHVVICIFFALQMLNLYQTWSFDPQIQDYCFELFACIALTMTAYQLACFDLDKGSHRKLWFWGLVAAYLCCLCLNSGLFFLAGALWAFANLTTLRRPRQRKSAAAEPAAE